MIKVKTQTDTPETQNTAQAKRAQRVLSGHNSYGLYRLPPSKRESGETLFGLAKRARAMRGEGMRPTPTPEEQRLYVKALTNCPTFSSHLRVTDE